MSSASEVGERPSVGPSRTPLRQSGRARTTPYAHGRSAPTAALRCDRNGSAQPGLARPSSEPPAVMAATKVSRVARLFSRFLFERGGRGLINFETAFERGKLRPSLRRVESGVVSLRPAATSTAQGGRSEASRRAAEPPRTRATQHPASGSQLRVRKTLPRLARVTRRSGAAAQPPETATTASIRARDLAANSRGFLNQPNAAGSRENRGSGLVRDMCVDLSLMSHLSLYL